MTSIPASIKIQLRAGTENECVFELDAPGTEGYVIGRSDAKSSYIPDVDLAECDALEKGVSRRHAALVRFKESTACLLDLDSSNGTFLNGDRLKPNQPYPLNDGDQIRLGTLTLYFTVSD